VLGYAMPASRLSRLSIGTKLALSFSVIIVLLIGSLSISFFYLSHLDSDVGLSALSFGPEKRLNTDS